MRFVFVNLMAIILLPAIGQDQGLVFNEVVHDFGVILEDYGTVEHTFNFTNKGNNPILITGVKPSCDCTVSTYTSDTVPEGGQGFVTVSFNPFNRPGPFRKSLIVTTNGEPNLITLYIEGVVKAKPRSIEEMYSVKMGDLRFKFSVFNFGMIKSHAPVTRGFEVYNDSDNLVAFEKKTKGPGYINIEFDRLVLEPKSTGIIYITYDPTKAELGYTVENIEIQTSEEPPFNHKKMKVVATIEEYFPPMTREELQRAPRVSVDKNIYDFGSAKSGATIKAAFTLSNSGYQPLKIRAIKSHCDCVKVDFDKNELQQNEPLVIRATFNTRERHGNQLISITIITNDPQKPMKIVQIKGRID